MSKIKTHEATLIINKQTEKEKLFLTTEFQPINTEGKTGVRKSLLATLTETS